MKQLTDIQSEVALAPHTTMQVGGSAQFYTEVHDRAGAEAAGQWALAKELPVRVLGEGSNIVVSDDGVRGLVIRMTIGGIEVLSEDDDAVVVRAGAGLHWDELVAYAVEHGWAGIEGMSMIPGTVGAAPVQNAGAYGQEIADTFVEMEAYDLETREFVVLRPDRIKFGYRTSALKGDGPLARRYIIINVTLKLSKHAPARPTYASLKAYLDEQGLEHPTLAQIREGVMAVRRRILPDPAVVPNSGSFFKNPIVSVEKYNALRQRFPDMPAYEFDGKYKLAAGWIMDQCGFKGAEHYGLRLHDRHALVITNPDHAGYRDLMKLVALVVQTAQAKFGVKLEPEPEFIR